VTGSVSDAARIRADEYWLIARAGDDIHGISRHPELAPSPALFATYLREWKDRDPATWWPRYQRVFLEELSSPPQVAALRTLYKLALRGKTIALLCWCRDPAFCHRSLVSDFLFRHGVEVREHLPPQLQISFPPVSSTRS
jgi:uncharacterized protein YeaO (DUF488 family)